MDLNVTDIALEKMLFYLKDRDRNEWGIRIMLRTKNDYAFSITELSKAQESDVIIDVGEVKILIDEVSAGQLNEATVDFIESELSTGFKIEPKATSPIAEGVEIDLSDPLVKKVHDILVNEINPGIAAHGGFARLVAVKDNIVYLLMGGGCQGCGMAAVTLKQGIETRIKEAIPEIVAVVDETDHASGTQPFYASSS